MIYSKFSMKLPRGCMDCDWDRLNPVFTGDEKRSFTLSFVRSNGFKGLEPETKHKII